MYRPVTIAINNLAVSQDPTGTGKSLSLAITSRLDVLRGAWPPPGLPRGRSSVSRPTEVPCTGDKAGRQDTCLFF